MTHLSLCALQGVSSPRSLDLFPCPDLSLPLRSPVCEYLARSVCFLVLTCSSFSSPGSECPSLARFVPCPDLFHPLCSTGSECPSLARFVSAHPDLSIPLFSPAGEYPLLARFVLVF